MKRIKQANIGSLPKNPTNWPNGSQELNVALRLVHEAFCTFLHTNGCRLNRPTIAVAVRRYGCLTSVVQKAQRAIPKGISRRTLP